MKEENGNHVCILDIGRVCWHPLDWTSPVSQYISMLLQRLQKVSIHLGQLFRTLFCKLVAIMQLFVLHILRHILHLLLNFPTDEIAAPNSQHRHLQFLLCGLLVRCHIAFGGSVSKVLDSWFSPSKSMVTLTDVEDAAQTTWLRSASDILVDSIVINARRIISFILDKPVAEMSATNAHTPGFESSQAISHHVKYSLSLPVIKSSGTSRT